MRRPMDSLVRTLWFLAKHGMFLMLAAVAACLVWTALYFALLLWAVITDSGVGGPLAWPAGLVACVLGCAAFGLGVAIPACAVAAILRSRLRWPRMVEIPISFLAAFALWFGWACVFHGGLPEPLDFSISLLWLPLPLGTWWWLTEGPGAMWDALRRWKAAH